MWMFWPVDPREKEKTPLSYLALDSILSLLDLNLELIAMRALSFPIGFRMKGPHLPPNSGQETTKTVATQKPVFSFLHLDPPARCPFSPLFLVGRVPY